MPFGDRTGPRGLGPMTGRGAGFCAGFPVPGHLNPVAGRGFVGCGRGGGRGRRNWFYATALMGWQRAAWWPVSGTAAAPASGQELKFLKSQAEHFESALDNIRERIEELETSASQKTNT